ncbi:MAG: tripartite tricarboxylate transporter TctB family protein [Burkholderiales bacterium]|nr:tripartite tricarboxylate transporter TctB family protein [Burkholderiales bacterium]
MKIPLHRNKDFLAGLMFIAVGGVAMIIAREYPFGSALRMGPGYFPTVLGGILVVFGIWVLIYGVVTQEPVKRTWSVRALIILPLTALVFGILMEKAGFIPALLVLSLMGATASPKFKFVEQSILAIGLTVLSVALFIWGLGLPYPLFAGH